MSDGAFGETFAKLTEIDRRLTARLMEAEQTLTAQMDNQFERILNRLSAIESDLQNLRFEHNVTRDLLTKLPATLRRAIEERLGKLGGRERGP
jgi:hypothetical protein